MKSHKPVRACRHDDPFLRPDWRWLRAQELAKTPGRCTDDELVNAVCDFLELGHAGKHQLALEAALELRQPCHADQCAELEARILSRQPICEVAKRFGLSEGVVTAYCAWFFDVCGRLSARDWVSSQVLLSGAADNSVPARLRGLWRCVGFFGGPLALEPLLAVSRGLPVPEEFLTAVGSARKAQEECLRLQIELYIATELATTPDDWRNVAKLYVALHKRFPESVSEIPAAHWMVLGGLQAKSKQPQKPKAPPATEKPTETSPSTRSSVSNAILATLLL